MSNDEVSFEEAGRLINKYGFPMTFFVARTVDIKGRDVHVCRFKEYILHIKHSEETGLTIDLVGRLDASSSGLLVEEIPKILKAKIADWAKIDARLERGRDDD